MLLAGGDTTPHDGGSSRDSPEKDIQVVPDTSCATSCCSTLLAIAGY
jgi:hypothetical protein